MRQISYSDQPLKKDSEITVLSAEEFNNKFKAVLKNPQTIKEAVKAVPELKGIKYLSPEDEEKLVICKISADIGYGVFSSIALKADTIIAEYTGEIKTLGNCIEEEQYYSINAAESEEIDIKSLELNKFLLEKYNIKNIDECSHEQASKFTAEFVDEKMYDTIKDIIVISAFKTGNISRFFSHLPNKNDFILLSNIQRSNLKIKVCYKENRVFLITTKDIEPFEQLGFDYEDSYGWDIGKLKFFEKETNKILTPSEAYNAAGVRFFKENKFDDSINSFLEAIKYGISFPIYYNIGRAYEEKKIYGRALESFEKARKIIDNDEQKLKIEFKLKTLKDKIQESENYKISILSLSDSYIEKLNIEKSESNFKFR